MQPEEFEESQRSTRFRRAASLLVGKKRLYRLLLVAVLAVALAACSKPQDPPQPKFEGTLTLWAATGLAGYPGNKPAAQWFTERTHAYSAANPKVRVQTQYFSPAELEKAVTALKPGSPGPDMLFGRYLPAVSDRWANVQPVVGEAALKDYLPNALEAFRKGEELLGLPVLIELQVLALNEKAFADAGAALPAGGRWSYDEFENSLRRLSGPARSALGFYFLPTYHEWWPFADGMLTPSGALAQGAEAGLQRLARYRQEGWLHPDTAKLGAEETWKLFTGTSSSIAIMPVGTWALPILRDKPHKLSVAAFPGGITTGYTYGFTFYRQTDAAKLATAVDLAQFMAAPDQQVRLARETGLMPARKSAENPFREDPLMTRAFELAATQRALPAGAAFDQAELQAAQELRFALLGVKPPKAALDLFASSLQSATAPTSK